jgi:hypothetical protein
MLTEKFDDLTAFASWWLGSRSLRPPPDAITVYGNMTGVCLFRDGCYQVQMFTAQPDSEAPSHIHPNVDSYELLLSGDLDFVINGVVYSHRDAGENRTPVRIFPSYWHEGTTGPLGGSFLSIQKWLNDTPPTCVGRDWLDVNGVKQGNCLGRLEE